MRILISIVAAILALVASDIVRKKNGSETAADLAEGLVHFIVEFGLRICHRSIERKMKKPTLGV